MMMSDSRCDWWLIIRNGFSKKEEKKDICEVRMFFLSLRVFVFARDFNIWET